MRKVFLFMMVSIDGYFEGENHDLSWHNVDDEFNEFANKQLDETDTLIFGRKTYDLMASYWPTLNAAEEPSGTARRMNSLNKVVFSRKAFKPAWENTMAYRDIVKLEDIKQQAGKSIAVLGSSDLSVSLLRAGLLDEIRIMVNPVAIGSGKPVFSGLDAIHKFNLSNSHSFNNGNVLLRYQTQG